jgi:integrase
MYEKFIQNFPRNHGKKPISIVRSECFDDFIKELVFDNSIKNTFRALIIACLSGGLRISEALSLEKESFFEEDGYLFFRVKVLKKRRDESRLVRVHPIAQSFMKSYLSSKVGKPFEITPQASCRKLKAIFGADFCNHSLRHSYISYLLFQENLFHMNVSKIMHVSVTTLSHYAHLDESRVLKLLYKNAEGFTASPKLRTS